jgi:hypothetical protein
MSITNDIQQLKIQASQLNRGHLPVAVEQKIRDNVFEIMQKISVNLPPEKFFKTTDAMYKDWSVAYSEDIRFDRETDAQKAMIKLSTFEWILALPSINKLREEISS